MPALLLNGMSPPMNSFVLPKHKIVWISVTKAASSSLRWMIADLAGEDFERFHRASGSHQTRSMTIHTNRDVWQQTPRLSELTPDELADISPDNGWLIFTMIRDPWTRLWSAWQSKFLVQHTPYVRQYRDEPWFPRVPRTPADIVDDWVTFVHAKPWEIHPLLKADTHFRPQSSLARPKGVNYSRIYDISEMSTLESDLHTHLGELGLDQDLFLPRANENPVPMPAEALDDDIADIIRGCYEADLAEWGDRWNLETIRARLRPIAPEAVPSIGLLATANERIGDLSKELKRAERRIATLEERESQRVAPTTPDGPPAGFTELMCGYPWPVEPRYPDVEPAGRPTRGFGLVTEAAAALGIEHPVIVDIGAELGGSTRRCLAIPGSYVVSIDPWKERQSFASWPALKEFEGVRRASLDLFHSFNFDFRDRVVAMREYSPRGLVLVHNAGLQPDIVYVDGDRRTEAVLRDITVSAALFPKAIICGAGWAWQPKQGSQQYGGIARPIREAVKQWAGFRDHFVETRENTWRIDPGRKFNLREEVEESAPEHDREMRPARAAIGKLHSAARHSLNRHR